MDLAEELNMLACFWEEKGDMERYVGFDRAIVLFPELNAAWRDYQAAIRRVRMELREAVDQHGSPDGW